jgi:S-adenosyl-L-methionine hydrolase (adenosine-forming)
MPIITLLSDFGLEDGYLAAMKGVIFSIAPEARLVDITHLVPPQDVAFARFRLLTVAPFFPPGTVHLAVVDPGVGTARRPVAVRSESGSCFVGPDNGILLGALEADSPVAAVELTETRFWRTAAPSPTFHGRDIFAPVAAHLASGARLESLGPATAPAGLVKLELLPCELIPGGARGAIQAVDRFGNLITNLPEALIRGRGSWTVSLAGRAVPGHRTYADVSPIEPLALVGSHGFVEVAVHRGDAQRALAARVGDSVQIHWT